MQSRKSVVIQRRSSVPHVPQTPIRGVAQIEGFQTPQGEVDKDGLLWQLAPRTAKVRRLSQPSLQFLTLSSTELTPEKPKSSLRQLLEESSSEPEAKSRIRRALHLVQPPPASKRLRLCSDEPSLELHPISEPDGFVSELCDAACSGEFSRTSMVMEYRGEKMLFQQRQLVFVKWARSFWERARILAIHESLPLLRFACFDVILDIWPHFREPHTHTQNQLSRRRTIEARSCACPRASR